MFVPCLTKEAGEEQPSLSLGQDSSERKRVEVVFKTNKRTLEVLSVCLLLCFHLR